MNAPSIVPKVDLCDLTQEPSDDALARLMESVAHDAVMSNREATLALYAELEREIGLATGQSNGRQ